MPLMKVERAPRIEVEVRSESSRIVTRTGVNTGEEPWWKMPAAEILDFSPGAVRTPTLILSKTQPPRPKEMTRGPARRFVEDYEDYMSLVA